MDWGFILQQTLTALFTPLALFYILGAQGLNIHFGYTGLLNFGQAGFMAAGAYGTAISYTNWGWPLWACLLFGIFASVVLGILLGLPTLRLRGDYLAIVTIAASEIIRLTVRSESVESVTGGNSGINEFATGFYDANIFSNSGRYELGPLSFRGQELWVMLWGWLLVGFFALLTYLLMRSPWGRVLKSVRENEDAVRSLGKNVYAYKMQSLVLGGVMGACGGIILALAKNFAGPDDYATKATFIAYTALILGGAATTLGPVIGGMMFWSIFTFVSVTADQAAKANVIPDAIMNDVQAGVVPFIFLGVALMLLMVFRPQGIFGDRKELEVDAR
ncbi:MAG: branched-chain amino acid ABC transporter permease [Microthrixaceae bacterium]|nr:branched-chain amino acid ABC transporter permease [Microthrixaceae bacterium]